MLPPDPRQLSVNKVVAHVAEMFTPSSSDLTLQALLDEADLHHAQHDAELARRLVHHLAAQPLPDDPPADGVDGPGLVVIDTFSPRAGHYHGIFKRLDRIPVRSVRPAAIGATAILVYTLDLDAITSGERERLIEYLAYQHELPAGAVALGLEVHSHSLLAVDVRSVLAVPPAPAGSGQ